MPQFRMAFGGGKADDKRNWDVFFRTWRLFCAWCRDKNLSLQPAHILPNRERKMKNM